MRDDHAAPMNPRARLPNAAAGRLSSGEGVDPSAVQRLPALKDAVDPDNVFHLNQNIRPSAR